MIKCLDEGVSNTPFVARGLASLNEWLATEFATRSPSAAERKRLQNDLAKVKKYVAEQSGTRSHLASEIDRITRKLGMA
jgi:hypothetical protein